MDIKYDKIKDNSGVCCLGVFYKREYPYPQRAIYITLFNHRISFNWFGKRF